MLENQTGNSTGVAEKKEILKGTQGGYNGILRAGDGGRELSILEFPKARRRGEGGIFMSHMVGYRHFLESTIFFTTKRIVSLGVL